MSEILKNFEKEHATSYDQKFQKLAPFKEALNLATQLALKTLPEQARVLIVGAGTGAELIFLAHQYPRWRFTAVEPSGDMLEVCRGKVNHEGLAHRCQLHQGYVHELDSGPAFHGATSLLVSQFLMDLDDRRAFFQDIRARLLPGGCLVTADLAHCGDDHQQVWKLWLQAIGHLGGGPEQVEEYERNVKRGVSFLGDSEMKELLASAGFGQSSLFFRTILINAWLANTNSK